MSSDAVSRQSGTTRPRLELFVRSLAPEAARAEQDRVVEHLRQLEERDRVESATVHVCGDCICPSTAAADTETGQFLLDRFEQFEVWATREGRELVGFRRRRIDSLLTGKTVTGITFPRMVLVEFVDGRIRFVAPSSGSTTVTVADRVDRLAGDDG